MMGAVVAVNDQAKAGTNVNVLLASTELKEAIVEGCPVVWSLHVRYGRNIWSLCSRA